MKKILMLEDDKIQIDLVRGSLLGEYEIIQTQYIEEAEKLLADHVFDIFLIDISLPDGNGLNFCTRLRNDKEYQKIPIFVVSSNTDFYTKIASLELGADDFILKPVHPLELKTKIKNKFKRIEMESGSSNLVRVYKFLIDYEKRIVTLETKSAERKEVELTNKEFDLFALLARNEGRIFSRHELIDKVWSKNINITDRVIDTHIATLRKKIKPCGDCIHSEYGLGYKFKSPAENTNKK